jgi:quercetin dioxygenase-like cupin family protein
MVRFLSLAFALSIAASAAAVRADVAPTIVLPNQGTYAQAPAPYPAGVTMAVLAGNPASAGEYTVRLKVPANVKFPPHAHADTENVTVISGTLWVGVGSTFDAAKTMPLPAGSFVSVPAGLAHFAMTKDDTVIQITGMGPASTTLEK